MELKGYPQPSTDRLRCTFLDVGCGYPSSASPSRVQVAAFLLLLMPATVEGMDHVALLPPPSATIGVLSMGFSAIYYFAGGQAAVGLMYAVPEVTERLVDGVVDITEELVHGSKLVVRCISIGVVIIAAIAIVRC